jgi:23S rRNA (uracil1939-C5)-methyltransferase
MAQSLPHKPRRGDQLELELERLDGEGHGLGSIRLVIGPQQDPRDYRVSVARGLPGERVCVTVQALRRNTIQGKLVSVLRSSPNRRPAPCPHFASDELACGGCRIQTLPYEEQLRLKEDRVRRLLGAKLAVQGSVRPILGMRDPAFYRNKMEFSLAARADGSLALGLHPAGYRYDVVPLSSCLLFSPFVERVLPPLARWLEVRGVPAYTPRDRSGFLLGLTVREGKRTGERLVEWVTIRSDDVELVSGRTIQATALVDELTAALRRVADEQGMALTSIYWTQHDAQRGRPTQMIERLLFGAPVLREELHLPHGRLRFEIHPRAFFQPNTLQAEVLYREIVSLASALEAGRGTALDLYCGTGTIGLCLAHRFDRVLGVELQPDAVANARHNAVVNGITNAEFVCGDAGAILAERLGSTEPDAAADLLLVDPPRSGLAPAALRQVSALQVPRMIYVSCNPEALARDLTLLTSAGYDAVVVQPIDMFPHTAHVETLVGLARR